MKKNKGKICMKTKKFHMNKYHLESGILLKATKIMLEKANWIVFMVKA